MPPATVSSNKKLAARARIDAPIVKLFIFPGWPAGMRSGNAWARLLNKTFTMLLRRSTFPPATRQDEAASRRYLPEQPLRLVPSNPPGRHVSANQNNERRRDSRHSDSSTH